MRRAQKVRKDARRLPRVRGRDEHPRPLREKLRPEILAQIRKSVRARVVQLLRDALRAPAAVARAGESYDHLGISAQNANVSGAMTSSGPTGRSTRHGTPAATTPAGMSRVTTLPAPMTDPLPIVTPPHTTAFAPIHTSSSSVMGFDVL